MIRGRGGVIREGGGVIRGGGGGGGRGYNVTSLTRKVAVARSK